MTKYVRHLFKACISGCYHFSSPSHTLFIDYLNLSFKTAIVFQEMEATVVDGNGTETGHIIVTTIGGRNGQPKQVYTLEEGILWFWISLHSVDAISTFLGEIPQVENLPWDLSFRSHSILGGAICILFLALSFLR